MDFKSRFVGKKSYINKRGDIVDPESKQVTTLRKPQQQQLENAINPPVQQLPQQPYINFRNQQTLKETQQAAASEFTTITYDKRSLVLNQ
jgi:hypothetical protein